MRQPWIWFVLSAWVILPDNVDAQDTTRLPRYSHYKETVLTLGYNLNIGDEVNGVNQPALHFVELGVWRSSVFLGHHPFTATYYVANDFGLNTDNFVIGPKVGGFISILVIGFGGELTYCTDFHSGSLRLLPYFGYCTILQIDGESTCCTHKPRISKPEQRER